MPNEHQLKCLEELKAYKAKKAQNYVYWLERKNTKKKPHFRVKSKAERRAWWHNLSDEQRAAYIEKRQAQKSERRERLGLQSTCTEFPEINDSNRAQWQARIHKLNPWLNQPASITQESR